MIPVGIDLGTTFSVIAHLDREGRPRTIGNAEGDATTPSAVFFDPAGAIVGKEAIKSAALEPDRIAICAKRDIGSPTYSRTIGGQHVPPEVVEACILKKLKQDAELVIGPFEEVVITVPAYFNEPRRKATQDAGRLAGLKVVDIINEPTAAAIAFGVQRGFLRQDGEATQAERLLVYDLGGGTFDVTLMQIEGRTYQTLATAGDVYLGGMDWDRRIMEDLADQWRTRFGDDPRDDPIASTMLLQAAEDAKRSLSVREEVTIPFRHNGQMLRMSLSRERFEQLTIDLLERTRFTTQKVLKETGLKWSELTRLLVVGGSSRMPMIQRMLERETGLPVDRSLSADEAVAHGAAIYAGVLCSHAANAPSLVVDKVINVNSHDLSVLGLEVATGRPRTKVMIRRNTALPATGRSRFVTRHASQTGVVVNVVEGGDASGNNSTAIGRCVVTNLPPGLPAGTPVEVVFSYARNGRLTVEAWVPSVDTKVRLEIERVSGMSEAMLKLWETRMAQGCLVSEALFGGPDTAAAELLPAESVGMLEENAETPLPPLTQPAPPLVRPPSQSPRPVRGTSKRGPPKPAPPIASPLPPAADVPESPGSEDDALNRFLRGLP